MEGVSGPAAKAGLQNGDPILGINNQPITSVEQFRKQLDAAGNRFALLIQRGGSRSSCPSGSTEYINRVWWCPQPGGTTKVHQFTI